MITCHRHGALPDETSRLWRYMNFAKLLLLLEQRKLFFVRADLFDDPYEGEWSEAGIDVLQQQLLGAESSERPRFSQDSLRRSVYLNCWHMSEYESAAMWSLYSSDLHGVAVTCRFEQLCYALRSTVHEVVGSQVKYCDYSQEPIAMWRGWMYPFFTKRASFDHEREFRVLLTNRTNENESDPVRAIGLDIEPSQLIDQLFVHPQAPSWFGDLVEAVAKRYSLSAPVVRSTMYARPLR